jgi:Flp pilus assembly protein TadB
MSKDRSEATQRIQALALEERLAHPEEDEALILSVVDQLAESGNRRRRSARRKALRIALAVVVLCALLAIVVLGPQR